VSRRLLLPRERGLIRFAELWLEDDALLAVHSTRISDRFARYRLRDVQAVVLTEQPLWNGWRAAWLGVSALFTLILVAFPPRFWKLWAIFPGFFLLWAIAHLARGPRCRLVLHTAVSTVTLEAVRTMRQARVAVPELRRLIESAQGRLAADGLTVTAMPHAAEPAPPSHQSPLLLYFLFTIPVIHALMLAGFYFAGRLEDAFGISATILFAEVLMGALAALRWRSSGPAVTVIAVLVAVLALADGGFLLYAVVKSFGGFFEAVSRAGVKPTAIEWLWLKEQSVARASWHVLAGVAGWAALLLTRREQS
jgi:hypothetical protein